MSDLKSGSSHMRLIFKVKKGQLSKLLLLNRPIIMAIYRASLLRTTAERQEFQCLKHIRSLKRFIILMTGTHRCSILRMQKTSSQDALYAVYPFHTSILDPGALFFLQLACKFSVMVLYDVTDICSIKPCKVQSKKRLTNCLYF